MKLVPKQPPGRSNRKARAYAVEIAQLHAQGYTLIAIREALANAGVHVSKSTVQREAAKAERVQPSAATNGPANTDNRPNGPASSLNPPLAAAAPVITAAMDQTNTPHDTERSRGKDIAEAFVRDRITNPLIRNRSHDENSRH